MYNSVISLHLKTHSSFSELLLYENVLELLSQSYGRFELGYLCDP